MQNSVVIKKTKIKRELTAEQKQQKITDIVLLCLLLATFFILILQVMLKLIPDNVFTVLNVVLSVIYGLFLAEFIFRIIKLSKKQGGITEYLKFNKAEPLYFVLMLAVIPLMFVFKGNTWAELFKWVFVFKAPSVLRKFNDEKVFNIIVKAILILLIIFFVVPFLNVIALAFSRPDPTVTIYPKGISLYSIKYVFRTSAIIKSFGISIFVTVVGTAISVVSMAMAAYPLSKKDMPLRKTMLVFFMIVMLFSGGMAPNIILMNSLNLLDTIWALIFPSVVMVFHMLLLKGFFEDIPAEMEESAKLDGAKNYRILISIIIPLSKPMFMTVIMFTAINYWNNLNNSILYIVAKNELYPIPMFIKNLLSRNPMDIAMEDPEALGWWDNIQMAHILVSIVPIACLYPFTLKHLVKGTNAGGVKG